MSERLLVCGSRTWTDREAMYRVLDGLHEEEPVAKLIHGAAKGADTLAGEWAKARGVPVEEYPADWKRWGRAAGPRRNQWMLEQGDPTRAIAFAVDLPNSKGTADMLRRLERARVPTYVVAIPAVQP